MPEKHTYSIKQVCEWFWDIERRMALPQLTEHDIYVWRLIRFPLYRALTEAIGLLEEAHPAPNITHSGIRTLLSLLHGTLFRNPLLAGKKENIVIPHMRQIGGEDIYSKALLESLPSAKTLVLHKNRNGAQTRASRNMSYALLRNFLIREFRLPVRNRVSLSDETRTTLQSVEKEIQDTYGITLPVRDMAASRIQAFQLDRKTYASLFKRLQARRLYLVVGYGPIQLAATAAAHQCGMEVIELQHGTFTPYHLGYSFPGASGPVPYSPDVFMCFGRFWPENTALPPQTQPHIIGAPYIEALAGKNAGAKKRSDSIVFTSQGVIGEELLDFAITCARCLPQKHIIFRLHPSEDLGKYEALTVAASPPANFSLSHRNPNIFRLLAETEIQVGVFSTTLFEGMVLGCKTIVVDMAGVEYMAPVIENGDALLVKTPEEFCTRVDDAPLCKDAEYYYAAPVTDFRMD